MHVTGGFNLDLNWLLQFIFTAFIIVLGLLYLVKNTASKYFSVDAHFDSSDDNLSRRSSMPAMVGTGDGCVVCGNFTKKQCAGCKAVRYCSEACQRSHWLSGHKSKCKDVKLSLKANLQGRKSCGVVPLISATRDSNISNKILFPYDKFLELFRCDKPGFPPCGLLNCGNSCFANVILQCLSYTRPLAAYLLGEGHRRKCRRNDWCFLCELQTHMERASQSINAFSPINILSRLPNIGGNLGYGKQEDAHEFMRFAVDTMQSVCLDEFGGEKAVYPDSQETTLIQHTFGGRLQSQVICTKCNNVSNQFENMMDLTVEIQGDAASLEECLDQFTAKEWLHGDNMYKCDGCNDYVLAWKRLNIYRAPNILTIAFKRFQSGRFGKLNKRVTFPEMLNLSPYMTKSGDCIDFYKLYAVVVHVDMLNASFFGHYICYTKDFSGNWYRIDDSKVTAVEVDEVLSQGAYMLLYSRVSPRQSCLNHVEEPSKKLEHETSKAFMETLPCPRVPTECVFGTESLDGAVKNGLLLSDSSSQANVTSFKDLSSSIFVSATENGVASVETVSGIQENVELRDEGCSAAVQRTSLPTEQACALLAGNTRLTDASDKVSVDRSASDEGISITCSTESSVSLQDHVGDKGERLGEVPTCTGEQEDGMIFSNCRGKPGNDEYEKHMPLTSRGDAVCKVKSIGFSGAQVKPLFQPGFLGKRTQNTSTNTDERDVKVPIEPDKSGYTHKIIVGEEGYCKPCFSHQSTREIEGEEKPLEQNGSTSSQNGKQIKSANNREMTSSISHDLSNGDTVTSIPEFRHSNDSYIGEPVDKMILSNSGDEPEKAEYENHVPLSTTDGAVCKLNQTGCSGAQLKPLLSPGFLGKLPRN